MAHRWPRFVALVIAVLMLAFTVGSVVRERCSMPDPGACCPGDDVAFAAPMACGSCMVPRGPEMASVELLAKAVTTSPSLEAVPALAVAIVPPEAFFRSPLPETVRSDQVPLTLKHRVLRI